MTDNGRDENYEEEPKLQLENEDLMPAEEPDSISAEEDCDDEDDDSAYADEDDVVLPGKFPTLSFNPGDVIFSEGDRGNEAYFILSGEVKITRNYKNKQMVINHLGREQIFGEMAIITGDPRTATAEALEHTEVFIITEEKIKENLSQHLAIIKTLIDQLIERLKQHLKQQSTFLSKIERSMKVDKKLKKLKMKAQEYEQEKSAAEIDEDMADLLQMIRQI